MDYTELNGMRVQTFHGPNHEHLEAQINQWLQNNPHINAIGTDPFPTHDNQPAVAVFYQVKS